MTGTDTGPLPKGLIKRLKITQREIERATLGHSLHDRIRNEEIRSNATDEPEELPNLSARKTGGIGSV